mgnify:CR=1 FL=1
MDAATMQINRAGNKLRRTEDVCLCMDCGAAMNEVERLDEGEYTYTWFECSKSGCDGQWLQKKSNEHFFGG